MLAITKKDLVQRPMNSCLKEHSKQNRDKKSLKLVWLIYLLIKCISKLHSKIMLDTQLNINQDMLLL